MYVVGFGSGTESKVVFGSGSKVAVPKHCHKKIDRNEKEYGELFFIGYYRTA
jgi:hypothetical protein